MFIGFKAYELEIKLKGEVFGILLLTQWRHVASKFRFKCGFKTRSIIYVCLLPIFCILCNVSFNCEYVTSAEV